MNRYTLLIVASILPLLAITFSMQAIWIYNSSRIEKQLTKDLIHIALSSNSSHQFFTQKASKIIQEGEKITPLLMEVKETQWRIYLDSILQYQGIRKLQYEFQILSQGALESRPTQNLLQSLYFSKYKKQNNYQTYQTTFYANYKENPFAYSYSSKSYVLQFAYNLDSLPIAGRIWQVVSTSIALIGIALFALWMALIAIKKQKKSEQVRIDFLNGMTHELNTPIAVIQLAAQYITKRDTTKDPFINETTSVILKETNKMKSLVTNILTTARLHKDKSQIKKEPVNIHALLEECLSTYQMHFQNIKHKKKMTLKAKQHHAIGDEFHLFYTFSNLIDNAIKYRDKNKKELQLSISTHNDNGYCIIHIQDNGIGISREEQQKIFTEDIRTDAYSNNVKGFGFGLGYVKRIIALHKETTIGIESELGKGSTFIVSIPTCIA